MENLKLNHSIRGFHTWPWSEACHQLQNQGCNFVLVTVMGAAGSTPRSSGTKMVVTTDDIYDTIGGGHLELMVVQKARTLLLDGKSQQVLEHVSLGASLGQCCGGSVAILLECMISDRLTLDVYGAGHVAHALITILKDLPVQLRWIDQRAELFPETLPANVSIVVDDDPVVQVEHAVQGSAFLVLTHNHQLDYALVKQVLQRGDAKWLGVIGSETKAQRFRKRLAHQGFSAEAIGFMQSPVGLPSVSGKLPMEVAVSIAGQLISIYQRESDARDASKPNKKQQGVAWKSIKPLMNMLSMTESQPMIKTQKMSSQVTSKEDCS